MDTNTPEKFELTPNAQHAMLPAIFRPGESGRCQADPIGKGGFPATRSDLDAMVRRMCNVLIHCGYRGITGGGLAHILFGKYEARLLRHLVAYARIYFGVHQIVGVPGSGYIWGDADPSAYQKAIDDATRRGRCYFFIAALHKREGAVMSTVQMVFDFMENEIDGGPKHTDDLAAMFAAEGVSIENFLDAVITRLADSEKGRKILANAADRHKQFFITESMHKEINQKLQAITQQAADLRKTLGSVPASGAA